jgi:cytosine/creatinine deaminase
MTAPTVIDNLRLPRWLLPSDWPQHDGVPVLARVAIEAGRVQSVQPATQAPVSSAATWDAAGMLALPGFVDAHTHLDKAFTLPRMKQVQPGLLGAIDAMLNDRVHWSPADVRERAARGLQWAWESGTTHLRTHVDWWEPDATPMAWPVMAELAQEWWEPDATPMAWPVMAELAQEWAGRVRLEQVSLIKLPLFEDAEQALRLAKQVKATGPHALLGGFVHSTNWSEAALRHLLVAAQACELDIDLHVDEELNAASVGLQTTARLLREIGYEGRVVCGHVCALAAQPEAQALATLDAVARAPITIVSLPATNLLLQDAVTGRTPRLRGITLVKEARERGIPLLFASDNVQDPFCRLGSFDPVEALGTAALVAQLDEPFDTWSEALCRSDWLSRAPATVRPTLVGAPADLVLFTDADRHGWPSRSAKRVVLREGRVTQGDAAPFLPR